ncbi:MAG: SH3 domain-containing protein [Bacillota bacterium]|nr:SH3 domain-containing protein [Bacillota bacterium]
MKKVKTLIGKFSLTKGLLTLTMMAVLFFASAFTCLAATGKVTADTAKIRAEASTDSEVVGSTVQGKTIDILDAVKDSSGTVWYKVSVTGGGYGYIRSDLVETSDSIEVSSSAASSTQTQDTSASEETQKPAETVPTSIGEQQATIASSGSVRIRSGASTAHDAVTSLPNGTVITLIGEANDNAGNKWYQMTCDYNGRKVEGYVRSDLITIGAPQPQEGAEGENTEGENTEGVEGENTGEGEGQEAEPEPVPEPEPEHNDYEIVYAEDPNTGESVYWLHDNVNKERQRLSELLGVASAANDSIEKLQKQVDTEKIVIIILAVVIVVLFIIITVLIIKIRNLYYEDYDEDYDEEEEEEEEDEEEPAPVRKRVKKSEEEDVAPPKKKKQPVKAEPELHAAERKESAAKEPTRKPAARKAQNFLIDDDEFEFEFLNMDDKDL